jgi:hypothetical protein
MMAAERIDQEAALFVAGFQLENDLSLEVRSYEFRRAIEPELKTRTQEALDEWHAILQAGPLVTPITPSEEQPEPGRVLSAIRGLNALAMLWSSGAVGDYLVTLPSQRKARLRTAELCSRAQMLGGLLWSLRGARAAGAQETGEAYRRAACLWRSAAQACAREDASWGIHPQEAAAAGLVARAAEAILRYPEDRPAAEQELRELAAPADSMPGWYTAGAPRLAELAGLHTHLQQRLSSIQQQAGRATLQSRQAGGQLKSQMQRAAWHIRQAQEDMQAVLGKTPQLPALRNIATALGLYLSGVIVIALIFNLRHDIVDLLACGLLFAAIAGAGLLILYSWVQLVRRDKESRDLYKEKLLTMDSRRVGVRQAIADGNQAVDEFDRISLMLQERLQKLQAGLQDVRRLMSAAMLGNPLPADFADARPLEDAVSAQARQVAELRSRSVRDLEAQRRQAGSDLLARTCSGQWEPLGFAFTLPQDIELNAAITLQGEGAAERRLIALQILAEVLAGQGYTAKGLDKGIWEFRRGSRLGKFFGFDIRIFPARIQARLEIPGSQTLVIRLTGRVNARKGTALNPQRLASELAELGNRFMMGKIETSPPTPPFQGASRSPKRGGDLGEGSSQKDIKK